MTTNKAPKDDNGKLRLSLFDSDFLWEIIAVLEHGDAKYGHQTWKAGLDSERSFNALQRHVFAHKDGQIHDPESQKSHLAHAACCLMMMYYNDNSHN